MECTICGIAPVRVQFDGQPFCMDCYNAAMAEEFGVDLPKLPTTFSVDDENGIHRIFEVERRIMGTGILLTARERWEHCYEFAVDGELVADQHTLFNQLKEKTKRGLSKTYLETGEYPSGEPYITVKGDHLKGVLSYSETNSEAPLVIIDGKPYTWKEVGRLLQAFEGFQVKIEMKDLADEWEE
ncbi:hypothetical protein QTL97_04830 [Sporosarcina thermotolerans]|uniref:Uncharacterized protein n=1 Tax=Sporosarcina thermotolerans TaxID=633404 RepID=A0AAW9A983_9BACL|nr:hypothetical protein [Sporosarcina thermotolerans]MDW0116248.1 hypothetical protein [Sporosarcina thermotolerans]WHT48220.1 hypothetical protein QNH10_19740 [Sporosarcina thermotolerans]